MKLTSKDLIFAGINGGIFGLMIPFVLENLDVPVEHMLFFFGFSALAVFGVYIGYLLSKIAKFFFQLSKFAIVGIANTAIDFGILNLLFLLSGSTGGYIEDVFKAVSFSVAVINSFFWNKYWSFEHKTEKKKQQEFMQFFLVSVVGAVLNVIIFHVVSNVVGPQRGIDADTWKNISAAAASILVLTWNFLGYKFIVFKK